MKGFERSDRGQLLMACGTGKTLAAMWIAERLKSKRTLVLVPSLSLLAQTLREWSANASQPFDYLAVCSDETVAGGDDFVQHTSELGLPVTTDPDPIAAFLRRRGRRVVFATYQSSPQIAAAYERRLPRFDLAVADEAHRCAGRVGNEFTTILDADQIEAKRRLFMTATPRYYTSRLRREAGVLDSNQRAPYREETLDPERRARLEALPGWTWHTFEAAWEEGFRYLQRFAEREGHMRVPGQWREDGFRLGGWVRHQREFRRRGELSDERARRLESVQGWLWGWREAAWEEGYARLQRFVQRESHSRVPAAYRDDDGYQLGSWVNGQRTRYAAGTLGNARRERLEAVAGWTWDVWDAAWEEAFARLVDYVEREGPAARPHPDPLRRAAHAARGRTVRRPQETTPPPCAHGSSPRGPPRTTRGASRRGPPSWGSSAAGRRVGSGVQRLRLVADGETERCTRCGGSGLVMVAGPAEERPNGRDPARPREQD